MAGDVERERTSGRIKLIGILFLIYGIYACMWAPMLFVFLQRALVDERFAALADSLPSPYLAPPAYVVLGVGALSAGFGLLRRTEWGRPVAIGMGLLSLLFVPVGTLFGLFALWALDSDRRPEETS